MDPSCITANPDISGIGVRTAIYAQNLLCFIPVVAYLWDGTVSPDELKGIKDQSIGMLAIAFAVLISTIIQATTAVEALQITRFHVAVILDLSWMNNTSTWIWFLLYAHHLSTVDKRKWRGKEWDPRCPRCRLEPGREPILATRSAWAPVLFSSKACRDHAKGRMSALRLVYHAWDLFSQAPVLILGSFHLSLMAAVGIVFWLNRSKFGTPLIDCDPTLTIVGGPALFSSRALQIFSLIMYFLLLIPGVNLLLPILSFLALHIGYNRSRKSHEKQWDRWDGWIRRIRQTLSRNEHSDPVNEKPPTHNAFLLVGLVLLVVINIIFLVDIELTLSRNKHLQSGEDDLWGFGQVLALLLLVMPLRDAWNALRDIKKALRGVKKRFLQALREEVKATPFVERLEDLIREGADPQECIKDPGFANSFQLAAYRGRKDILEFFLSEKIPAEIETKPTGTYGTALQAASAHGHVAVVQLLLENRTVEEKEQYINLVGGCYGSALCAASANDKLEVAELLIAGGAKAELDGKKFGSPLHVVSLVGKNTEIITLLLGSLGDRDPNGEWGIYGTALDVAQVVNKEAVNYLKGMLTETAIQNRAAIQNANAAAIQLVQQNANLDDELRRMALEDMADDLRRQNLDLRALIIAKRHELLKLTNSP